VVDPQRVLPAGRHLALSYAKFLSTMATVLLETPWHLRPDTPHRPPDDPDTLLRAGRPDWPSARAQPGDLVA
jgi:hypothetical protein